MFNDPIWWVGLLSKAVIVWIGGWGLYEVAFRADRSKWTREQVLYDTYAECKQRLHEWKRARPFIMVGSDKYAQKLVWQIIESLEELERLRPDIDYSENIKIYYRMLENDPSPLPPASGLFI